MSKESLKAFQCPSCGAPLEAKVGASTAKCIYCGTTIRIPQESAPSIVDIPQNHQSKRQREVIEAEDDKAPPLNSDDKQKERFLIILFIAILFFIFFSFAKASKSAYQPAPTFDIYVPPTRTSTVPPPSFAEYILTFGSEGIVPGKFTNAAALTVDSNGNVVVTDWNTGRFNTFDAKGNFISMGSTGKDAPVGVIAATADGQIMLLHNFEIHIYDAEGKETGVMNDQYFGTAVTGPDGLLYTVSLDHTISHYNQDRVIDLQVQNAFENFTGASEMTTHLAVDGLGNMYLLGEQTALILKFSPEGTFLDQFGGAANTKVIIKTPVGDSPFGGIIFPTQQPGTFEWPQAIAVDDYGRIYVCDTNGLSVFSADNRYIESFELKADKICKGLAFDRQNHLYILTDQNTVEKYEVPKP